MRLPMFGMLFLLGCSSSPTIATPDSNGLVIGAIEFYQSELWIEVPSTVQRGEPFKVMIGTAGGGCVVQGSTEVDLRDQSALITPYDIEPLGPRVCSAALHWYRHEATLRFDEPGEATLIFRGRREPSSEVLMVRRTLQVQ